MSGVWILLLHTRIYWKESITKMLWIYTPKELAKQLNNIKVGGSGVTSMEKFSGTAMDITLKHQHTLGCPVYIIDDRLQNATPNGLSK